MVTLVMVVVLIKSRLRKEKSLPVVAPKIILQYTEHCRVLVVKKLDCAGSMWIQKKVVALGLGSRWRVSRMETCFSSVLCCLTTPGNFPLLNTMAIKWTLYSNNEVACIGPADNR